MLAAAVAVALTACVSGPAVPSGTPTPVATMVQPNPTGDGTVVIGALVPLSGANAAHGNAGLAGVELAARDIAEAGGALGTPVIVVPGDAADATSTRGAESVATFAGRGVDAVVGPNSADLVDAIGAAALAAGLPGVTAVAEPEAVDDAFAARLRSSDPTLADTAFGAESYDATVMIALAAELAGDDGAASIAEFLPAVTSGGVACSSYGACLDVLKSRADIRYTGVASTLTTDAAAPVAGTLVLIGLTR